MPCRLRPADRGPLLRRERLGDQHVVVDRHHVAADRPHQRREAVGREHDAAGAHRARRRSARRRPASSAQRRRPACARGSRTPSSDARARQAPGQPRRVDDARCRCAARGRRGTSASRARAAPPRGRGTPRRSPYARSSSAYVGQLLRLVRRGRDDQVRRSARSGVDAEPLQRRLDARQVLGPSRSSSSISSGKRARPFGSPWVSDASHETPVAAAAAEADPARPRAPRRRGRDRPAWPGSRPTAR